MNRYIENDDGSFTPAPACLEDLDRFDAECDLAYEAKRDAECNEVADKLVKAILAYEAKRDAECDESVDKIIKAARNLKALGYWK